MKRNWDVLSEAQRQESLEALIDFFATERGEEIGIVAAGEILDVFLESTGKKIYNRAIEDTKKFLSERWEALEFDLEATLKKD